jgi:hypothetical protein
MVFEEYRSALREAFIPSLILGLLERHGAVAQVEMGQFLSNLGVVVAPGVLNRIMRRLSAANLCIVEIHPKDARVRVYRPNLNTHGYRGLMVEDLEYFDRIMKDILTGHHHTLADRGPLI